ncbi:unnamed protein product [Meloidogyne enterolobii]|uniref:Uncharacterized protein n=1 Tax=Meloidogyne enterolobii TaxID=390850 RepID=A0ACB0Y4D7_MELEN
MGEEEDCFAFILKLIGFLIYKFHYFGSDFRHPPPSSLLPLLLNTPPPPLNLSSPFYFQN